MGQSYSTHGMTIIGVDINGGSIKKLRIQNSWGQDGDQGQITATRQWFEEYAFKIMVHKKHLSAQMLKSLSKKAISIHKDSPIGKDSLHRDF